MDRQNTLGHLAALLTIFIWGTTFISTKLLLTVFQPVEILFFRFLLGFFALLLICPRRLSGTRQQELTYAAAGLCGICLYYLLENIALTFTLASNVGVMISISPFFTALISHFVQKGGEKLRGQFFIGFAVAMTGICLISFSGARLRVNPVGDLLAVLAAFVWACYAVLTRRISSFGQPILLTTRRVFFYGMLFMLPTLFFFDFQWGFSRFANPSNLFQILFLGLGASALCFVTWNFAVQVLGAVKTSLYIYMVPVITAVASVLILHEQITLLVCLGIVLTLAGLILSERRTIVKKGNTNGLTE